MDPMDRIRSRMPLADLNIGKQHLLSKVIGKRFAAAPPHPRAGLVEIVNLDRVDAKSRFLGPNGFGYVTNFVRYASKSLEELWQTVENKLDNAIAACSDRSIFDHPEHVRTIKDAIALHLVRSVHTRPFLDDLWTKNLDALRARFLDSHHDLLAAEFTKRYGLLPGGPKCLEMVLDEALAPHLALKEADAYFRDSLERLFQLARTNLDSRGLEVSTPATGEFLIGDAPAIAVGNDGRLGLLGGVGVNTAKTIALPLGPHLLASTGDTDSFLVLDPARTAHVNQWQVFSAASRAFCRPGSGLATVIRESARVRSTPAV